MGMTVVSPIDSTTESPSTIGVITPTRRMLFERTPRTALSRQTADVSVESRQDMEINDLKLSNHRKDNQLRVLHERFHHIQQGLGSIDEERSSLVEKAKKLEKEKKHIQRQLELREREILALVKRCASQEEKMRESSRLRAHNKELANALESVQSKMHSHEQEVGDLATLNKQLQASELAREELQERLRLVQRQHDSIAKTLQECLENIRQLTDEKEHIEDLRRRERKTAEIQMEKQRLAHVQVANTLKDDIESKQLKIDQMEKILQDNIHSKTALRRQRAIHLEESESTVTEYKNKIADLEKQLACAHDSSNKDLKDEIKHLRNLVEQKELYIQENLGLPFGEKNSEYEQEIQKLRNKILEKEAIVAGLESEFSGQMGQLMEKQSSLDETEEEKRNLEAKVKELESLETEHSALMEFVRILDSNLADLTSENAHLILERDNLKEEADKMHMRTKELERQMNGNSSMPQEDGEKLKSQLENSLSNTRREAQVLESELSTRSKWISKLELELRDSRKALIRKEQEIKNIAQEQEEATEVLAQSLAQARDEIQHLEAVLQFRDHQLATASEKLEAERLRKEENQKYHGHYQSELPSSAGRDPPPADENTGLEENRTKDLERLELEKKVRDSNEIIKNLDEEIEALNEKTATSLGNSSSDIRAKRRTRELQISRQKANIDLRAYQEQVRSVESRTSELQANRTDSDPYTIPESLLGSKVEGEIVTKLLTDVKRYEVEKKHTTRSLDAANTRIRMLEEEIRRDAERNLQGKLKSAQEALQKQEEKVRALEKQYADAMQRAAHDRKAASKISVLEDQIVELKVRQAELKDEAQLSLTCTESKDKEIRILKKEKLEMTEHISSLQKQAEENESVVQSVHGNLAEKEDANESLHQQLQETRQVIEQYESDMKAVETRIANNDATKVALEEELSAQKSKIEELEESIEQSRERAHSLDEQLQEALQNLAENASLVKDAELKVAEKSLEFTDLEKKFELENVFRLELESKLTTYESKISSFEKISEEHALANKSLQETIDKSKARITTFEEERAALLKKCQELEDDLKSANRSSDDRLEKLEEKYSQACESLATKQTEIESIATSRNQIEDDKDKFELQLADAQEEILLLEQEIKSRDTRIEGLEKEIVDLSKNEIEQAFVDSEEKRMKIEQQLSEANSKAESLSKNLGERESRLMELDSKLEEVVRDKEFHRKTALESSEKCSELEDRVKDLDSLIAKREAQMLDLGTELNVAQELYEEKEKETKNLKNVVDSLETTVNDTKKSSDSMREMLESQLEKEQTKNVEISAKFKNSEMKAEENTKKLSKYQTVVLQQDDKIDKLQKKLHETIDTMGNANRELTDHYSGEISKLETDIALKEDEIRELRVIDLQDKEETIKTLSEALEKLKEELDKREVDSIATTNELKRENKLLKSRTQELEESEKEAQEKFQQYVDTTGKRAIELEAAQIEASAQLQEQDAKLRERHEMIQDLSKREAELKAQEKVLLSSCDQLVKSETTAKEELEKLKNALDIAIVRAKEDLDIQRQEMEDGRQKEVGELSTKLKQTEEELTETDRVLTERTSLLSDMVEHNKDLESKLDKQEAQISALEEETTRGRRDLSEAQTELKRAREDLCKRENSLTAKLNEERTYRDNAERSLAKLKVQYKEATKTRKTIAELEKDNAALKDKIARQEAYLQRKLKKEKVQRSRTSSSGGARTPVKAISSGSSVASNSLASTGMLETPPRNIRPKSLMKTPGSTSRSLIDASDNSLRSTARSFTSSLMAPRTRAMVSSSTIARPLPSRASPFRPESRDADDSAHGSSGLDMGLDVE